MTKDHLLGKNFFSFNIVFIINNKKLKIHIIKLVEDYFKNNKC